MAATTTVTRYPGDCDDAHPEIFTVPPAQPTVVKSGQLSQEQVKQFFEQGYLIVENFFRRDELDPCRAAVEKLVDDLAQKLYDGGKIKDMYKEKGLFERLTFIEKEYPGANIILHKQGILSPAFRAVWTNERLLNLVEQLIGPDIAGHPVWNLRTKTPQNEATTVPWHQDSGYLDNDSYTVLQPTAWIPLLDSNAQNGCMEMASRGHRTGRVARHTCCWENTWYIDLPESEMEHTLGIDLKKDLEVCPVPYGGMLLLNNMIPHRSLPNTSNDIRWSLDLRWQDPAKSVGFYGLKHGLLMRDSKNPDLKVDWDSFDGIDRHTGAKDACHVHSEVQGEKEFETTIQGPWMMKWEMTHQNRHTEKLDRNATLSWHNLKRDLTQE